VLTEILDSLQIGSYVVKLNHRKLLDAMMAACGASDSKCSFDVFHLSSSESSCIACLI
jgi:histidyl-tRNA synthetase